MPNRIKAVLIMIVCLTLPAFLLGTAENTSSFQEFQAKEVSDIILIENNTLVASGGLLNPIEAQIWEMARKYELEYDRFLGLAMCESTLNQDAKGKAGEIGIYQFLPSTFSDYCDGDIFNPNNQIECAAKMISNTQKRR